MARMLNAVFLIALLALVAPPTRASHGDYDPQLAAELAKLKWEDPPRHLFHWTKAKWTRRYRRNDTLTEADMDALRGYQGGFYTAGDVFSSSTYGNTVFEVELSPATHFIDFRDQSVIPGINTALEKAGRSERFNSILDRGATKILAANGIHGALFDTPHDGEYWIVIWDRNAIAHLRPHTDSVKNELLKGVISIIGRFSGEDTLKYTLRYMRRYWKAGRSERKVVTVADVAALTVGLEYQRSLEKGEQPGEAFKRFLASTKGRIEARPASDSRFSDGTRQIEVVWTSRRPRILVAEKAEIEPEEYAEALMKLELARSLRARLRAERPLSSRNRAASYLDAKLSLDSIQLARAVFPKKSIETSERYRTYMTEAAQSLLTLEQLQRAQRQAIRAGIQLSMPPELELMSRAKGEFSRDRLHLTSDVFYAARMNQGRGNVVVMGNKKAMIRPSAR